MPTLKSKLSNSIKIISKIGAKKTVTLKAAPTSVVKKPLPEAKTVTAVKKVITKKSIKTIKKPLVVAPDQKSFWVKNGLILNSLAALKQALLNMDAEVYSYHARKDTNHFSDWVLVVLNDEACASDLKKAATVTKAQLVVTKHLKNYKI